MSLAAELLLAELGIHGILSRDPITVLARHRDAVDPRARQLVRRARSFATANVWDPYVYEAPEWRYRDVIEAVNNPVTEAHYAEATGLPDSLAIAFQEAASTVLRYLQQTLPVVSTTRAFGVELLEPSDTVWATYCRTLRLANRPQYVLDLLDAGTLLPAEVAALRAMYPEIYGEIGQAIFDAVVDARTSKPSWRMDWRRELLCARYAGTNGFDQSLAAELQASFAKKEPPAPPSAARVSRMAEGTKTQVQRTEAR